MNENYRGLPGVNYPENGKKWYQTDFQEEQNRISGSVLDRESDILSSGIISGWEVSLSATSGAISISPGSGRDALQRRMISSTTKDVVVPDGQTSVIIARHVWIDEDYFSTVQEKNSVHIPDVSFLAVAEASANDISLCTVSRNGSVVTILSDLRTIAKILPTAKAADLVKDCSPDAEKSSGKKIVLFNTEGKIDSDITGSSEKLGGEFPEFYSQSTHSHNLADLAEKSYYSLTDRPSSVGQLYFGIFNECPESVLLFNGAIKVRELYPELMALLNAGVLGTLVSDTEWLAGACGAFSVGDGSTTIRMPDWRGIFPRFQGINSVLKTANNTAYNGGSIFTVLLDKMMGHLHGTDAQKNSAGAVLAYAGVGWNFAPASVGSPISDGTNGTPRLGNQTAPVSVSIGVGIYYK